MWLLPPVPPVPMLIMTIIYVLVLALKELIFMEDIAYIIALTTTIEIRVLNHASFPQTAQQASSQTIQQDHA